MCVAENYAVVCLESIANKEEQAALVNKLTATGKEIIPISLRQVTCFAGNMLQVKNRAGQRFLVLSATARQALTAVQTATLERYNEFISPALPVVERNGGGSARCMIAEVFL